MENEFQPSLKETGSAQGFFNSPPLPNTLSQDTFGTLLLTVQYFCNLWDAMLCHWSPSTFQPNLPMEAENFPWDGKNPKDVSLPKSLV